MAVNAATRSVVGGVVDNFFWILVRGRYNRGRGGRVRSKKYTTKKVHILRNWY